MLFKNSAIFTSVCGKLEWFSCEPLEPGLMFVGKAGTYLSGASL